jgi:hypothetical protein
MSSLKERNLCPFGDATSRDKESYRLTSGPSPADNGSGPLTRTVQIGEAYF